MDTVQMVQLETERQYTKTVRHNKNDGVTRCSKFGLVIGLGDLNVQIYRCTIRSLSI